MFGRCALRLRQYIHLARKRGFFSRRSTTGSSPLVARHRQVHASCEAQTGSGHKRRSAKQAYQYGVLGHKGAGRKRLCAAVVEPEVTVPVTVSVYVVFGVPGFELPSPPQASKANPMQIAETPWRSQPRQPRM